MNPQGERGFSSVANGGVSELRPTPPHPIWFRVTEQEIGDSPVQRRLITSPMGGTLILEPNRRSGMTLKTVVNFQQGVPVGTGWQGTGRTVWYIA